MSVLEPVLSVRDLRVSFPSEAGRVDAVRGVSFDLMPGQTLGIVGESGSGKSVTALAIIGLLADSARTSGSVKLAGRELLDLTDKQLSDIRGRDISMIFQDPLSSLTPVFTVGDQLVEALTIHGQMSKKEAWARAVDLLQIVGIPNAAGRVKSFPHEFSGGMRQRVVIAIAMANNPKLIIADEPTTALDVTIQAQILDVIKKVQSETGAAVIMITHDMGVVAGTADDVLVMYAGKPVEQAPVNELFYETRMPYSIGLLAAIPRVDSAGRDPLVPVKGNPPILINLPPGCPFAPRCPIAIEQCTVAEPELAVVAPLGLIDSSVPRVDGQHRHRAACIRSHEINAGLIGGEPVYPVAERPESDLTTTPRDERPSMLSVTNLMKTFPVLKGSFLKRRVGTVYAVNGLT
ncbi:MAG: ABC transporter ATP-binding protein, partial [Propionibacteriaceae bacterium]